MPGVTPEDLYRLALVSSPSASRDGSRALFVLTRLNRQANRYDSSVWLHDGSSAYPLPSGPGDTCPSWSPDGSAVAFVRTVRQEGAPPQTSIMVMRPGSEPYALFTWQFGASRPQWSPDGRRVAFMARAPLSGQDEWRDYSKREALIVERLPPYFNGEGFIFDRPRNIYVVDSSGGQPARLTSHALDVSYFAWSPDGSRIAYVKQQDEVRAYLDEVRLLDLRTGEDRQLASNLSVAALAWSPDGSRLALLAHRLERGLSSHYRLFTLTLDGRLERVDIGVDRNLVNGVNSEARGPSCPQPLQWAGGWLYFLVQDSGRSWLYRATPEGRAEPVVAPEDAVVDDFSVADDGTVYFLQMDEAHPNELYAYRPGRGVERLTGFNDAFVSSAGLRRARRLKARSRDGTELDYWLLEPYRQGGGRWPWVLYIHGGPKTSYGYGFMFTFHAIASAGIAVVYGNPRGSDGYGEEFADIRGRWGTVDYEDLMAIADAASQPGQLDPSRAGVAGGSYGGFMTNWIITRTDRVRAAVTERSCVEWYSDWGTSDIGWYFDEDQLGAQRPWASADAYIKASPMAYIESVKTPTLIMHALEDYRCPLSQAIQLFTALKVLGVETRLALFPGENHDLTRSGRPRSRVEYLGVMLDWLTSHLLK